MNMKVLIVATLELKKIVPSAYLNSVEDGLLPWMTALIKILEKDKENEYYIVSASGILSRDIKFSRNGINYSVLSLQSSLKNGPLPFIIRWITGFCSVNKKFRRIVEVENPDVISIHGTYGDINYRASKLHKPKLVTIDMFYDIYQHQNPSIVHSLYATLERNMLKECSHFTYRTDLMKAKILEVNSNAKLYPFSYPIESTEFNLESVELQYDIIYAARLHEYKGVFRYLDIVKELKQLLPTLKAKLIGSGGQDIINMISDRIHINSINDVLEFSPNIESKQEFLKIIASSRLNVYPVKETMISGTIVESLSAGTPILTYHSQLLENLNTNGVCIMFADSETSVIANAAFKFVHNTSDYKHISDNCIRTHNKCFYVPCENILHDYIYALRNAYEDYRYSDFLKGVVNHQSESSS